jgi:hypothetical protein
MASSEYIQPFACRCSLRKCIQGDLEIGMARVEVRSVVISAEEREHMEVVRALQAVLSLRVVLVYTKMFPWSAHLAFKYSML